MKIEIIAGADTPVTEFFSASNTPETDALIPQFLSGGEIPDIFAHARKLERERNNFKEFLQQGSRGQQRIAESNKFLMRELIAARKERDEAREHLSATKHFLNKYIAERDEAREVVKEADAGHDMAIADLAKCEAAADKVIARAKELIVRWDAPSWKDSTPTVGFINALRIAVRAYENKQQITDQT